MTRDDGDDARSRRSLRNAPFLIRPINFPQRIANFAHGRVGPHAVDDEGHGVGLADAAVTGNNWLLRSRALEGIEPPTDFGVVAAGAQGFELAGLLLADAFVDIEDLRLLFFDREVVYADDDLLSGLHRPLILVRRFGDFLLGITILDGANHAAHRIE